MEKVWLSTTYYLDERMAGMTPAEEQLFIRLLAFCGASETAGEMPPKPWTHVGLPRGRAAFAKLLERGVVAPKSSPENDAEIPPDSRVTYAERAGSVLGSCAVDDGKVTRQIDGPTYFPAWTAWQKQGDDLVKRRKSDRDRKRKERALSAAKSRDMSRDVRPLEEKRREEEPTYVGSAADRNVASASAPPREVSTHFADGTPIPGEAPAGAPSRSGRGPAPSSSANTLAATFCPTGTPGTQIRALAVVVQELLDDPGVQRADLESALAAWRDRPGAGPRLLPGLVADAAKARAGGVPGPPGARPEAKQRTYANLIQKLETQAAQQQEIES